MAATSPRSWSTSNSAYVEEVNPERLFASAVNGMLNDLDENSMYIGPEEAGEFRQALDQEFGGIGIHVEWDKATRELIVMGTIVDTPAYKAGMLAGDKIVQDRRPTRHRTGTTHTANPRQGRRIGPLDDPAAGRRRALELAPIERAIIQMPSVLGDTRKPDGSWDYYVAGHPRIAYVRIANFGKHTTEEFERVMSDFSERGFDALVLDLRNNPGGYLEAAVQACDMFLERGTIVTIRGRDSTLVRERREATGPGTYSGFPMAVLVNRFSASASEIVAASLQDHGGASSLASEALAREPCKM